MKRIKKLCSYVLVGGICFSLFCATGCGFDGARTDEEIYSALANATKEMFDYNGGLTIKMSTVVETEYDYQDPSTPETTQMTYSINPSEKIMYYSLESEKVDCIVKLFKEADDSYLQVDLKQKQTTSGGGSVAQKTQQYKRLILDQDVEFFTSCQSFKVFTEQELEELFGEYMYTFAEMKAAYETVYADQLARQLKTDERAKAEHTMSTKRGLGTISLEECSKMEKSADRGLRKLSEKSKIVGKNGKIARFELEQKYSYEDKYTPSWTCKTKTTELDIKYSFDKKGYNKIETSLPANVESYIHEKTYKMKLNVGGMLTEVTAQDANPFNAELIFGKLKKGFSEPGSYTVEWYEDEAYTTKFEPKGMSYEDFIKHDCVYGKVIVDGKYAVVATDYKIQDERSEAYKAAFGPIGSHVSEKDEGLEVHPWAYMSSKTVTLPLKGNSYNSFVNGKKYGSSSNEIELEGGKFYLVEHYFKLQDANYYIFNWNINF